MNETVAIVGAGTMGTGVAQVVARAGYRVLLVDISESVLARARATIERNSRLARLVGAGDGEGPERLLERIECSTTLPADAAVVIESVPERRDVKQEVHSRIDASCRSARFVAANNSAIAIDDLAGSVSQPERLIGMHFMNPAPLKHVVEVIPGPRTADATVTAACTFLESLNLRGVVVKDGTGFVSNRALMLLLNEAMNVVHEGVASPADVDDIFRGCFGHPMGPLETADLIGLDNVLDTLEVLSQAYGEERYRPSPLLRSLVDAGRHGRKTGDGVYQYA